MKTWTFALEKLAILVSRTLLFKQKLGVRDPAVNHTIIFNYLKEGLGNYLPIWILKQGQNMSLNSILLTKGLQHPVQSLKQSQTSPNSLASKTILGGRGEKQSN